MEASDESGRSGSFFVASDSLSVPFYQQDSRAFSQLDSPFVAGIEKTVVAGSTQSFREKKTPFLLVDDLESALVFLEAVKALASIAGAALGTANPLQTGTFDY